MKWWIAAFALFVFSNLSAQYYYKDIVGTAETAAMLQRYKSASVSRVSLQSFDEDNTQSEGLAVSQTYDAATGVLQTRTSLNNEQASILTTFINAQGQLVKTTDSSGNGTTVTTYDYNPDGKLLELATTTSDATGNFVVQEEHQWLWDGATIKSMMRLRGRDTTAVSFVYDERGNVVEEHNQRKGVKGEPVYYYYNENDQLTDIVRYNSKAARLLPEYMFEYNSTGQVIQRMTFPPNSSNYSIWRYQYNAQGLRSKEALYNKQKQLTGKIEYSYSTR